MKKLFFLFSFFTLFGCSKILSDIYGIKELNSYNQEKVDEFYHSINFSSILLVADSIQFKSIYEKEIDEARKKDLGQPIQILYFENEQLKSFHANCYAKPKLDRLDWNIDDRFEQFMPKSAIPTSDFTTTLDDYKEVFPLIQNNKENVIIIFWTLMLEKQSKTAVDIVINNIKKFHKAEKVEIYLINIDKVFIE